MSELLNPRIAGVRASMLLYLYGRRLRAHPAGELLAGGGVAIGVALVFGVLLANASLTSSASELVHGLTGSARYALVARSPRGFGEGVAQRAGELPGVQVAAPVLRENVTVSGPRGLRALQLIGVSPSVEALGGQAARQYAEAGVLLSGGVGLPAGVAGVLGAGRGGTVRIASGGLVHAARVKVVLGGGVLGSAAASPVVVSVLSFAQALTGLRGRVGEVLIRPQPGRAAQVRAELERLAGGRLDVRAADYELGLLAQALSPSRRSTSLFEAIGVMIGFLLALNAVLLTVPERRRFIAEQRMQGYDARQLVLLLGFQALALGLAASLVGVVLGDVLAGTLFRRAPEFLGAAFPVGTSAARRPGTALIAIAAGVLAAAMASALPLLELRARSPVDLARASGGGGEALSTRAVGRLALCGGALVAFTLALVLLAPGATVAGGVTLALATLCLIPGVFAALARWVPRLGEGVRSSALIVAFVELRTVGARQLALAGIVGIAVYGAVAIGGARADLLRGIAQATTQYFQTARVWVSAGRDVFNTNGFAPAGPARALSRAPGVAAVRVYRGGLLDVGERRVWVRARPAGDRSVLETSQLREGSLALASRAIRAGAGAAVSSDYAGEHGLRVGGVLRLPAPAGTLREPVVAILSNSGWPGGTITIGANAYERYWGAGEAAALEVDLAPGVSAARGRRTVRAALAAYPGLAVSTAAEREALSDSSAREGLRTLGEISALLLVAAALAVSSALAAALWQRRLRLAALKMDGYGTGQLWRAVLLESAVTIAAGAVLGAVVGVCGHALASRYLERATGFPAPFAFGGAQVLGTLALIGAIALAVLALPGVLAARVPARAVLQE